jgi:hypothetical protein
VNKSWRAIINAFWYFSFARLYNVDDLCSFLLSIKDFIFIMSRKLLFFVIFNFLLYSISSFTCDIFFKFIFFQYYVIYLYIYRQFLVDIKLNHHRGLTISNFLFLIVYFFIQFMLVIMFFHFCHNLNVINYLLDGFRWYIFVIFRSR